MGMGQTVAMTLHFWRRNLCWHWRVNSWTIKLLSYI